MVYGLLVRTVADTLRIIAADPRHLGAQIGCFAVLHTWGQTRVHHPPLHCVIPGGGLSSDGTRWVACRPGFFLPVRVLSRLFRRLFLEALHEAVTTGQLRCVGTRAALSDPQACADHLQPVRTPDWVVYATPSCGGPTQVVDDIGRYTHRVAIANHRLLEADAGQVRFRYRDYRDGQQTTMRLAAAAFIRRVLLHVLPPGFHRMRYDGFLSTRHRAAALARCRQLLGTGSTPPPPDASTPPPDYRDRYESLTGVSLRACPVCHDGHMIAVEDLPRPRPCPAITDTS